MDVVSQYRQVTLPRLRTTKEILRRDSIASSRTGDSGYHSDADVSGSPSDLAQAEKLWFESGHVDAPPYLSSFEINGSTSMNRVCRAPSHIYKSILLKERILPTRPPKVTSNPSILPPGKGVNARDLNKSHNQEVEHWLDESITPIAQPKERLASITSLSSSGSGEDYSATDDSECEEMADEFQCSLPKATLTTVDLILRKIEFNLSLAAIRQCAGGCSSRATASNGTPNGRRGSAQSLPRKRKGDNQSPDNQEDDGANKRRRMSTTTTEDSDTSLRFACPFYKHDLNRYRNRRTCPGPGWPTVHRMKEHLYRSHAQPIFCPRCYTMFDTDSELSNHLRRDPCHISDPQPVQGIDRATQDLLRRRSPPLRLEEDKWRDTYRILFPDVAEADIPSPYYDSVSPTEDSRRFRRELLQRIRRELLTAAEQEPSPVEQHLLQRVSRIIQTCERELLSVSSTTHTPFPPPPASGPDFLPLPTSTPHGNAYPTGRRRSAPQSLSVPQINSSIPSAARDTAGNATPLFPTNPSPAPHPGVPLFSFEPTSEWINWDDIFPPGADLHSTGLAGGEAAPTFSTPVWT